jgi:hypothetical protein
MSDPFGLMAPSTQVDPYPVWASLRRDAPAHFSEGWNAWLLTRYDDVAAAFKDKRFSANRSGGFVSKLPEPVKQHLMPLLRNLSKWTLLLDPPQHTRLRGLISKAFVPRAIEAMRPRITELVNELVARAPRDFDLISGLAQPLPTIVIGDMLGMPADQWSRLKTWSDALAQFMGASQMTPEVVGAARQAVIEMEDCIREVIADHRARPREDLMTLLLKAEDSGQMLDEAELLATCTSLLFGGHETTTNLIGNGLLALLQHPQQLARLRAEPALMPRAVEEFLRFDSPVARMGRVALEDVTLHGQTIKTGDRVFMVMGSANRDSAQFSEADALDVAREENKHLSMGLGIHYCVGATLGRLEAQVAIAAVLERSPALAREKSALEWIPNLTIRGLKSLPVTLA